jgi:hypothetical protein
MTIPAEDRLMALLQEYEQIPADDPAAEDHWYLKIVPAARQLCGDMKALRADAARYRWLRSGKYVGGSLGKPHLARVLQSGSLIGWKTSDDHTDAICDAQIAAIAAQGKP